jgi:hypothetical protein
VEECKQLLAATEVIIILFRVLHVGHVLRISDTVGKHVDEEHGQLSIQPTLMNECANDFPLPQ